MESVLAFPYACAIITGCGQWVHGPWGERLLHSWIVKSGGTDCVPCVPLESHKMGYAIWALSRGLTRHT